MTTTLYNLAVRMADGGEQPLDAYRGKVLLVVNTASQCGFTPQYEGLEALWRQHQAAGLVVLGFPCNQFGGQEPGTAQDIASFCSTSYNVTFPVMAKISVNGAAADPLYQWLKREKAGLFGTGAIKWNFTKFLVGRDGQVIGRYPPSTRPSALAGAIEAALSKSS